ncbi:Com family DNA-binding transcriptional regulator [Undibacterium sp.]|uniref:Com family DNA-binding transcriptional regulator n=1 Tax=Undibacterium sp. TaxID=1914977 RepID=UPI00273128CE|nr:Com family DNA-binding transcriptional regulator [Undibacterium sp.]MDP1980464.1 Com family DNA-binding transcriptional regulator [Undibacterium sp.]
MQEIRCGNCSKKLGAGEYIRLSIKCPRCKALNELSTKSEHDERHRASLFNIEENHVCNKETNSR